MSTNLFNQPSHALLSSLPFSEMGYKLPPHMASVRASVLHILALPHSLLPMSLEEGTLCRFTVPASQGIMFPTVKVAFLFS